MTTSEGTMISSNAEELVFTVLSAEPFKPPNMHFTKSGKFINLVLDPKPDNPETFMQIVSVFPNGKYGQTCILDGKMYYCDGATWNPLT